MSGLVFLWARSLFFRFSSTSVFGFLFFVFERQRSGSNRTPLHALVLFVLVLFLSRRAWFIALFGRASCFLAFSSGCHSGPRAFLGFSWNVRLSALLLPGSSFFPLCLFCSHTFPENPSR